MSRAKGNIAEERACVYLYEHGFEIVDRNFYARFGEIDIIVAKESILHFVEVKSGADYESAIYNITPRKLSRLLKTCDVYIKKNGYDGDYMIDAVVVTPEKIEHLENITL